MKSIISSWKHGGNVYSGGINYLRHQESQF